MRSLEASSWAFKMLPKDLNPFPPHAQNGGTARRVETAPRLALCARTQVQVLANHEGAGAVPQKEVFWTKG